MTNCPNCGAPVSGPVCLYCGTQFRQPEETPLEPLWTVINPIDTRCILPAGLCQSNDAVFFSNVQREKEQKIEQARQYHEKLLMDCQNVLPYQPMSRPVCKKQEEKRKPFENDQAGFMIFIFLLILVFICFSAAVLIPFIPFVGPGEFLGKTSLIILFGVMGVFLVFVAKSMYKGDFS